MQIIDNTAYNRIRLASPESIYATYRTEGNPRRRPGQAVETWRHLG